MQNTNSTYTCRCIYNYNKTIGSMSCMNFVKKNLLLACTKNFLENDKYQHFWIWS